MKIKKRAYKILLILVLMIVFLLTYIISQKGFKNEGETSCLSLTFDDGLQSHYNIVYPLLKERDFSATFFIIANLSDFEGERVLNQTQIRELENNGFEIGSHTLNHPYLLNLNEQEIEKELRDSKELLEKRGFIINSLAIPYRGYDEKILEKAKQRYAIVRDNYNINFGGFSLNAIPVQEDSDFEEICDKINEAKENNYWLILIMHDVSNNPQNWDISPGNFNKVLNCAQESNISVNSLKGCQDETGVFNTFKLFPGLVKYFYEVEEIPY